MITTVAVTVLLLAAISTWCAVLVHGYRVPTGDEVGK